MYPLVKHKHKILNTSLAYCCRLIDQCFSLKSSKNVTVLHALLVKVGFNRYTFLGNRCLDLYCRSGSSAVDVLKVFDDIALRNVVSWNICLKGLLNFGHMEMACSLFDEMPERDVVSWNSMIVGHASCGHVDRALERFRRMQISGVQPSEYTYSILMSVVFATLCGRELHGSLIRRGFSTSNVVLGNSLIDMYGKLGLLDYSVEAALLLFVLTLREDIRPTEYTFSSLLSVIHSFPVEQGTQIHCLVIRLGFDSDAIVASSLVDMYSKFGFVNCAVEIFSRMTAKDLTCWNTLILGLTHNNMVYEALDTFKELLQSGPPPDRITFCAVLLACTYGGFVDVGLTLFSSMIDDYGIPPSNEHFACLVNLLFKAGRFDEAVELIKEIPYEPDCLVWESLLDACAIGDLNLIEGMVERLMEVMPEPSMAYQLLTRIYEMQGKWESLVRLKNTMRSLVKPVVGFSWIGMKNQIYVFDAKQLGQPGASCTPVTMLESTSYAQEIFDGISGFSN
ncbi:unnamed protein product [Linum tenue]|uniref:Chlororespiratory reduction 4 n=1 Tax=Linum tenue TaxID=586396 RepID=A0AAV0RWU5_9ROSI|nr:unnamed protein product [Linum tenue]